MFMDKLCFKVFRERVTLDIPGLLRFEIWIEIVLFGGW